MALDFGKLNFSTSFNPTSAFPLDARSYFESYDAALLAAQSAKPAGDSTTKYYYGETVCVVDVTTPSATLYIITPQNNQGVVSGTLQEVGSKIAIDANQFVMTDGTTLSLLDFATAVEGAQLVKSDGKVKWVKPDTTTVEGLSTKVTTLEEQVADRYTKAETDTKIAEAIAGAGHISRQVVTTLPELAEAKENVIYMVKDDAATGNDKYKDWMLIEGALVCIGDTSVDLTPYMTTQTFEAEKTLLEQADTALSGRADALEAKDTELEQAIALKADTTALAEYIKTTDADAKYVAKVGYVEYTQEEKDKLGTIAENAQVNVMEAISINGVDVPLVDKKANIDVASDTAFGVVKLGAEFQTTADDEKKLEVKEVNVNKLVQTVGDTLILDGGTSANA